ncbi:hypothetical protein TNCT_231331 [Trichonephila clavata]|uniref:Uncharacterized protein n=1 Tax=Trichonephila clavata TaxID=2740835 RepID=A0A8X6JHX3_TRICU|nr:hypothetical protein TNCT_231331 [Trichonephila clavata]
MEDRKRKFGTFYSFPLIKAKIQTKRLKIVNGVYGLDTVITNYVKFWFRLFCSDMPIVKNVVKSKKLSKLTGMFVVIASPRVLNRLHKGGFKNKLLMFGCHTT